MAIVLFFVDLAYDEGVNKSQAVTEENNDRALKRTRRGTVAC